MGTKKWIHLWFNSTTT